MNSSQVPVSKKLETDVAVIGGGGTGLAAAVAAAEKGARVILLEKNSAPGGTSLFAVGLFAAESPAQKRMSISVPKDEAFSLAMDYSHWRINPRLWRAFVNKSGDTIQWLEDKGLKFNEVPSMYPGQIYRTWHCPEAMVKAGPAIVKLLRKNCTDLGVQLLLRCPAKRILTNKSGKITGVAAASKEQELRITTKSVVIATGGYGSNKALLKKYYPAYQENMKYIGAPNMGDGLLMAIDTGAATEGLGTLILHPHSYPGSAHINAVAIQPSLVWLNQRGERFTDETKTFNHIECGNAVDRQPEKITYAIFDEQLKNRIIKEGILTLGLNETGVFAGAKLTNLDEELQLETRKEGIKIADSWDKIAQWMGVAPKTLKATIAEYNSFCDQGYDELFAKDRRYLQALRTPPYCAIRCYLSFLTTIGGIKINHRMEVLNNQDNPIPGLFAGGDTTGGWEADTYCMALSGSAFGFAVNSGRIAGENAAKYVLRK